MIATAYFHSYGVPVCVTWSSNNYGPCQYPEKIIPRFVTRLLQGKPVTVHGHGEHVRNWLHVEDNCQGVETVLRKGIPGEVYNLGGGTDLTTNELITLLIHETEASTDAITYVPDRAGNDIRYSMDWKKAEALGFRRPRARGRRRTPAARLSAGGLAETVEWYRRHPDWWPAPTAASPATA
ncbi:NAD-dependent epimerase/dehydratase family protein [Streptomyces mirabilis]|uniref:NAD-dependent epimerase/dehydratase family protein n=1 Tax=Streptomyces mirabilis TaxID=68239 RepID=UPI0036A82DEC